ncbi:unnamed protein product, partial [Ectocarpus sp. 12 AP-2014]
SDNSPPLHLLYGKITSGKSTLTGQLASGSGSILIVEREWLNALFADQMPRGADNPHYSS